MTEILKIGPGGRIDLPDWVWLALYKQSGIRSKKRRHVKKAVKRELHKAIIACYERVTDAV